MKQPWIGFGALALAALAATPQLPLALIFVHAPLALAAGLCALAAALRPGVRQSAVRTGRRLLGLLCVATIAGFVTSADDWTHALWSVQFPLTGLLLGSGLLLFSSSTGSDPGRPGGGSGPSIVGLRIALLAALGLGLLPLLMVSAPFELRVLEPGRVGIVESLWQVVRYGFGGPLPGCMRPIDGLGSGQGAPHAIEVAPRMVTVLMASSLLAALHWVLFASIALAGRLVADPARRGAFLLLSPMVAATALFAASAPIGPNMGRLLYRGIWRNDPWLVASYGPTMAIASLFAVALLRVRARA